MAVMAHHCFLARNRYGMGWVHHCGDRDDKRFRYILPLKNCVQISHS